MLSCQWCFFQFSGEKYISPIRFMNNWMLCSYLLLFRGKLTHIYTCVWNKHVCIFMHDCIMPNFLSNVTWKIWVALLYQNDKATHYWNLTANNSNILCASVYEINAIIVAQNWSNPAHKRYEQNSEPQDWLVLLFVVFKLSVAHVCASEFFIFYGASEPSIKCCKNS